MFATGVLTATRRPGFAGRPRASTTARSLQRRRSSFVPPVGLKARAVDDKMEARGRAASPTKAGEIREDF